MGSVDDRCDPVSTIYFIDKLSHLVSKGKLHASLDFGKGRSDDVPCRDLRLNNLSFRNLKTNSMEPTARIYYTSYTKTMEQTLEQAKLRSRTQRSDLAVSLTCPASWREPPLPMTSPLKRNT